MSFERYPEYRDSGVDWLGPVPAHWEVVPLKRVVTLNDAVVAENTPPEIEIDYVEISDVSASEGITSSTRLAFADAPSRARRLVKEGDVLVSTVRTYLRAIARVGDAHSSCVVSTGFAVLRPHGIVPDFAGWALQSEAFVSEVIARSVGISYPAINATELVRIQILLPPPAEQAAIAAFLNRETAKIDGLIGEQRRLVTLLKEKRQAVIAHAVTKGLNPAAALKPSGIDWLGDIPAHWGVGRLAAAFLEIAEAGDGDLPILSVSIHDGVSDSELDDHDLDRKVTRSEDRSKYKRVAKGDLVYNMMRAWQGGFGSVTVDGQVSPAYVVARPIGTLCSEYVESVLRTPPAVEQMRRYSKGVTDFRLRLYWDEFKNLQVPMPPPAEQAAILAQVAAENANGDKLIAEVEGAITLLQERRAALISAAVTGKIDVREVVAPTAATRPALSVIDGGRADEPAADMPRPASTSRVRLLVAARVVERLAGKDTFGRTQMVKYLYLAENHLGISELDGRFEREAAGPLDRSQRTEVENALLDARIARTDQEETGRRRVHYTLLPHRPDLRGELIATIGADKATALDALITAMETFQTPSVEAVATLHAAWNDALIDGRAMDEDALIAEVETNWHEDKSIQRDTLVEMLGWMKRNGIVPTGAGSKTIPTMQGSLF